MDDNWGKLYQAILNFNQPLSVVANTLQFREEIPTLVEGSSGALTPPLSDNFNWSISLPVFGSDEAPVSQLGIAPVNTAAPSPQAEDNDAAPEHGEPVTIWGLLYAKEMTFRERMARLQFSITSPMARRGRIRRIT